MYLYGILILHIDRADDLDFHVFAMKVSSFVQINVLAPFRGYFSRPLDLPRIKLAIGRKLLRQQKQVVQIYLDSPSFLFWHDIAFL